MKAVQLSGSAWAGEPFNFAIFCFKQRHLAWGKCNLHALERPGIACHLVNTQSGANQAPMMSIHAENPQKTQGFLLHLTL